MQNEVQNSNYWSSLKADYGERFPLNCCVRDIFSLSISIMKGHERFFKLG